MKPGSSFVYLFIGIISLYFFCGAASAELNLSDLREENCSTVPSETITEIRDALSAASSASCPVYSQAEPEYDEDGWKTTEPGAMDIGSEIFYEGDRAAHWICYPDSIINACRNLSLADGWHLEAYQFYEGGNANAKVYALPEGSHLLPPEEAFATETGDDSLREKPGFWPWPPAIASADEDVMSHIMGDDTPLSYLEASLLSRERNEVGAAWHGISWGVTSIIDSTDGFSDMNWNEPVPPKIKPVVCCSDRTCTVTFYTHTSLHEETITRNEDTYTRGSYNATTKSTVIATGETGFYF